MPPLPKRPCAKTGCPALVQGRRYCEQHQHIEDKRFSEYRRTRDAKRGSAASRGYGSQWTQVRSATLQAEPLCRRCDMAGQIVIATTVHHLDHNPHNNSQDNLEPLCRQCHETEHKRSSKDRFKFGHKVQSQLKDKFSQLVKDVEYLLV